MAADRTHADKMELRDFFAAKALPTATTEPSMEYAAQYIGIEPGSYVPAIHWPEFVARQAYAIADAMMEERKR